MSSKYSCSRRSLVLLLCILCGISIWITETALSRFLLLSLPDDNKHSDLAKWHAPRAYRAAPRPSLPRVLAIVFPQFHPDPLNDRLWGENFTDWENLRQAPSKNREGYDIPRPLPLGQGGLGYYDLRDSSTRRLQGELAKNFSIDGFVYHHYWFYDEAQPGATLQAPLERMLRDRHPSVPFFFNWCAINWVDTWSGKATVNTTSDSEGAGKNILQAQVFPDPSSKSVQEHFEWLSKFFRLPNYLKFRGQPVLMLRQKKPSAFPILKRFRELAKEEGFDNIYILVGMSKTHDELFPEGRNEGQRFNRFPPNTVNRTVAYPHPIDMLSKKVLKIPKWCRDERHPSNFQVPGILTSFDNTPRRDYESAHLWSADEPHIVVERFRQSLYATVYYETCCVDHSDDATFSNERNDGDERLVVINSLNEWAEGMALEPSTVFGHRLLQVIKDVKQNISMSGCDGSGISEV